MKREDIPAIIELSFVLIVTSAMYIYGLGKYIQFDNQALVTKGVSELTGMELMWVFYGYSKSYAVVLGILEVVGGTLLLIRKTRILGGLLLTGILMNVIVQDIFYEVNVGALKAAIIYQIMILGILWLNRTTLLQGIKAMLLQSKSTLKRKRKLVIICCAILLAILLKVIEFQITH